MIGLIFFIFSSVRFVQCKELKMITMLARHGARYSVHPSVAAEKRGQISPNGLHMCYLLGTYMKDRYSNFFPKRFNFNENYVLASGFNRTQQSAQAFMLGLYGFGSLEEDIEVAEQYYIPEWKDFDIKVDFKSPLPQGYQPVPVHSYAEEDNTVFNSHLPDICPQMIDFMNPKDSKDTEITNYLNTLLPDLHAQGIDLKKIIGKETFGRMFDAFRLGDFVEANFYLAKLDITKELYRKIDILKTLQTNHNFFRDTERTKFFFTELGRIIYESIKSAVDNIRAGETSYKKFNLFFGHDLNLYTLYILIGLSNFNCMKSMFIDSKFDHDCLISPSYASSVVWELHQEGNQFLIDFYINGEKYGFCHKDPEKSCSFEEFTDVINKITLNGDIKVLRNRFCQKKSTQWPWALVIVLVIDITAILCISFLIYKKTRGQKY